MIEVMQRWQDEFICHLSLQDYNVSYIRSLIQRRLGVLKGKRNHVASRPAQGRAAQSKQGSYLILTMSSADISGNAFFILLAVVDIYQLDTKGAARRVSYLKDKRRQPSG